MTATPPESNLICSECLETAIEQPPRMWTPAWGPRPCHSHIDGEPLCSIMTTIGYRSAEPITGIGTATDTQS